MFVEVSTRGEVTVHEGWLTTKEARKVRAAAEKAARGDAGKAEPAVLRAEVTAAQEAYIDLHRHAVGLDVLGGIVGDQLTLRVSDAARGRSQQQANAQDPEGALAWRTRQQRVMWRHEQV